MKSNVTLIIDDETQTTVVMGQMEVDGLSVATIQRLDNIDPMRPYMALLNRHLRVGLTFEPGPEAFVYARAKTKVPGG